MITDFLDKLNSIVPLSLEAIEQIEKITTVQRLPKGTLILAEGQVSEKLFFLSKGLARAFYFENEDEITSGIFPENDFIFPITSFTQQKPSSATIYLLEDSTLLSLPYKEMDHLYKNYPEISYLSLRITERYVLLCEEMARTLRLSAEERCTRFQKKFPHIVSKVKVQHLSSYLGLSRSSINLLRSKK